MIPDYFAPIVDHLWQSTLFAVAAGLLTIAFRNNRATVRYALWLAASVKFLIPFSLLVAIGSHIAWHPATPVAPAMAIAVDQVFAPAAFQGSIPATNQAMPPSVSLIPTMVLAIWAVGFAAVLFSWWRAWRPVRTVLRHAKPLHLDAVGLAASFDVRSSPHLLEPAVVGVRRPVLLLPDGIMDRLEQAELQAILVHEMCHIRRRDNLAAMMHMVVEALFWFHPLVWWLEARLIDERERACDEEVLASGNDPAVYAESILKICRLYVLSSLACASGVSGANLKKRVEEILGDRATFRLNTVKKAVLAGTAMAAIALPLATGVFAAPRAIAQIKEDLAGIPTLEEVRQRLAELQKSRTAIPFDPKQFDKFVGFYQPEPDYGFEPYVFFAITRRGEHFVAGGGVDLISQGMSDGDEIFAESATTFFSPADKANNKFSSVYTFITDAQGVVTGFVQPTIFGVEMRTHKVDEFIVKAAEAALAERVRAQKPDPRSEAALRRYIAGVQSGHPDYAEMTPVIASIARRTTTQGMFRKCGTLTSLTFVDVNEGGQDEYDVVFDHSRALLIVNVTPNGKYAGAGQISCVATDVASAPQGQGAQEGRVLISVEANGAMYWNGERITFDALDERLKQQAEKTPQPEFEIEGLKETRFNFIDRIVKSCGRNGIQRVHFQTVSQLHVPASPATTEPTHPPGACGASAAGDGAVLKAFPVDQYGNDTSGGGAICLPQTEPKIAVYAAGILPAMSKRLREEGDVTLLLSVLSDGRVVNPKVETSSGHTRLDEAATKASRSWRFVAGTVNGRPAPMQILYRLRFRADN